MWDRPSSTKEMAVAPRVRLRNERLRRKTKLENIANIPIIAKLENISNLYIFESDPISLDTESA